MNDLLSLFTSANIKILSYLEEHESYVREIAEELNLSPATVHRAITFFKEFGLVDEYKKKNRKLIRLKRESPILKQVRAMLNLNKFMSTSGYQRLRKFGSLGLYGSFALGEDDPQSDIDVWLYLNGREVDPLTIRAQASKLEKELGREIRLLLLDKTKLDNLKRDDPEFYLRLKLTSILGRRDIFD